MGGSCIWFEFMACGCVFVWVGVYTLTGRTTRRDTTTLYSGPPMTLFPRDQTRPQMKKKSGMKMPQRCFCVLGNSPANDDAMCIVCIVVISLIIWYGQINRNCKMESVI